MKALGGHEDEDGYADQKRETGLTPQLGDLLSAGVGYPQ